MNPPHSKTIRNAVAGSCVFLVLLLLGWFVLREPPVPAADQPVAAAIAPPRVRHVSPRFAAEDDADRETMTNQIAAPTAPNAAMLYRQAFALYDELSEEQKHLIVNWRTNVDSSVAAELCEKIQPICDLLHQAAAVSNCDWGLEQPIAFATPLPHLSPCRNMARAAVWNVAHCRADDPAGAVDDLAATSRLGQNVSSPALVCHNVGLAIQNLVIDAVAEHASVLTGTADSRLIQLFGGSPYEETLSHAIEQQADVDRSLADGLVAMPPEEAMRELMTIGDGSFSQVFQSLGHMQAATDIRQVAELEKQFAKALELPEAEYREWLASLEAVRKTNPFVDLLLTPIEPVVNKTQAMTVMSAMAAAGLAVMQDGPDALQSHPDPTTGQPFTYTPTSEGFELQSGYQFKGEPVKLRFK
jgi:hypothetical protein